MHVSRLLVPFVLTAAAAAQELVADVNPQIETSYYSDVRDACVVGNTLYFVANDQRHGREVWKTDGTTAGTQLAIDLVPGAVGSDPGGLTAFAGGFVFIAGGTLYWSSGAPSSVVPLGFAMPVNTMGTFGPPTVVGARVFFVGPGPLGAELWSTDGTPAGTFRAGPNTGPSGSVPNEFAVMSGVLYYAGWNANQQRRLFRSDGTLAGTHEVAPGTMAGPCERVIAAGNLVYFGSPTTHELWRTDGTVVGTILLHSGFPSGPVEFAASGNHLLFSADDGSHGFEPWLSDGTPAGTHLLRDVNPGPDGSLALPSFATIGGVALFTANDGVHGYELWRTDLTANGTLLLRDIEPGSSSSYSLGEVAIGNEVWFAANESSTGNELWRSDGTAAGTVRIADIRANEGSEPSGFTAFGGRVFFVANDGVHGAEPWLTDGTAAGTRLLRDVASLPVGSEVGRFARLGERTVFQAAAGLHGREPWITDGTTAGTQLLADIAPGAASSDYWPLAEWQGRLWFAANTPSANTELWSTDGSTAGTAMLADLSPGTGSMAPWSFVGLGDRAVFFGRDVGASHLFVTDGTAAGTHELVVPGLSLLIAGLPMVRLGDYAYFTGRDVAHGVELWRTDGSVAGTTLVADLDQGPADSMFSYLQVVGDRLFFGAATVQMAPPFPVLMDDEPWVSDGTAAGTLRLADLVPGLGSSGPMAFTAFGGRVWFLATTGYSGGPWNLYVTDGTPAGTGFFLALSGTPDGLVPAGDRLFFRNDGELWSTDGTQAGTGLVADLWPGSGTSVPRDLVALGTSRKLVFTANTPNQPRMVWVTDGTAAGTHALGQITVADTSSLVFRSGRDVFVAADDGLTGTELHVLRLRTENAAMADVVSTGCAGTTGVPRIRPGAGPQVGTTFAIHLDGALAAAPAFASFAFGLLPNGDRVPCSAALDMTAGISLFLLTDPAGHASTSVTIPAAPWVLGLEFYSQWIVGDPAGGYLGFLSMTPVLDWMIGN